MTPPDTRLLVAADTTIDLYLTDEAAITPASTVQWFLGGTGANVATGIGLFYNSAELMTNVGTDFFGTQAERYLEESPISTRYLSRVDATSPLTLYVPERAGGPRWDAWIDGSCFGFTLPGKDTTVLEGFDWMYLSATTLPQSVNWEETTQLLDYAASHEVRVAFDLNGRSNQWPDTATYRARLETILPHCDVVFASQEDLSLAGIASTPNELVSLLSDEGSVYLFITRGADRTTGIVLADGQIQQETDADPPEVDPHDPAGAGDAFAAAVLSALFDGESDIDTLIEVGNAAGAAAVMSPGALRADDFDNFEQLVDPD